MLDFTLRNDSNSIGYAGMQLMKGKIIVIDNNVPQTKNMVIRDKYVIAATDNVEMRTFDPANPFPRPVQAN